MDKLKRAKLRVKKSKAKSKDYGRRIRDIEKKIIYGQQKQTELLQKWHDRIEAVRKALEEALQVDTSNLKTNERFLSNQLQQITELKQKLQRFKDKDVLAQSVQNKFYSDYVQKIIGSNKVDKESETKHHRLRITVRFWDELFAASPAGEVEQAIKLYLAKIAEAENIINQSQEKSREVANQISAILQKAKDDKMLAMRLGHDLDKLKNSQQTLGSDSLKPRGLRQIEYALKQIKKKYGL